MDELELYLPAKIYFHLKVSGWSWVTWWWSLVWGMGHQHQCSGVGETRRLHLHMLLLAPKPKHHHTHPNSTHASLHWISCPQHHVSQCVNPLLLIVFTWTRSDGVWVSCQRFQPTVSVWSVQQLFSRKYFRSLAAKYFYQVIAWRVLCVDTPEHSYIINMWYTLKLKLFSIVVCTH